MIELTIKFSEDYEKLPENWEGTYAMLAGILCVNINWLKEDNPKFIEYDTTFRGKKGSYPLNFEKGMILTFIHESGKVFTTIRREYPSKLDYYDSKMGCDFKLVKSTFTPTKSTEAQ